MQRKTCFILHFNVNLPLHEQLICWVPMPYKDFNICCIDPLKLSHISPEDEYLTLEFVNLNFSLYLMFELLGSLPSLSHYILKSLKCNCLVSWCRLEKLILLLTDLTECKSKGTLFRCVNQLCIVYLLFEWIQHCMSTWFAEYQCHMTINMHCFDALKLSYVSPQDKILSNYRLHAQISTEKTK